MKNAIEVKNLSKTYKLYSSTKERIMDLIYPKSYGEVFSALKDVNFEVAKGDSIGFVGINGSGKSTLSNIIAGIVPATNGEVLTNGNVSLIAVSAGLKAELTGRANIEMKLLMLGFSNIEIKEMESSIIEFSELDSFIDQPVKSYSSGMKSKLGFAISVRVNPDIIIIDEALSVGDKAFAEKSLEKMKEFKQLDKTMIFVSHSLGQMRQFCDKILWLEFGRVKAFGNIDSVLPEYETFVDKWKRMNSQERLQYKLSVTTSKGNTYNNNLNLNKYTTKENVIKESLTSLLGQIKPEKSYIYNELSNLTGKVSTDNYKNSAFYIKKEAKIKNSHYYLLSSSPSYQRDLLGWIDVNHVHTHSFSLIDEDPKELLIGGGGKAYTMPWGRKDNQFYPSLKKFKDQLFCVKRTSKVGKNVWYYGLLEDNLVWIHQKHLYSK